MDAKHFISIVVPVSVIDGKTLNGLTHLLTTTKAQFLDYELILMECGLSDDEAEVLNHLMAPEEAVRIFRSTPSTLHGNEQRAVLAGLQYAIGDYVIVFHPRQDPAEQLPNLLKTCLKGFDVVYGVMEDTQRKPKLGLSPFYHWFLRSVIGKDLPSATTHFRCMTREVVNGIKRGEPGSVKFLSPIQSFRIGTFEYNPSNTNSPSTLASIRDGIEVIVHNTLQPLVWARNGCIALSLGTLLFFCYQFAAWGFTGSTFPGWGLAITFMLSAGLGLMAITTEYLAQFIKQKHYQPSPNIELTFRSQNMIANRRLNVLTEAQEKEPLESAQEIQQHV